MMTQTTHNFGLVDEEGDAFEFIIDSQGSCRLIAVLQTERGPRRSEVAQISESQWTAVAAAAVRELISEMGETEREKKAPTLHTGVNRISPLVGRELGVLLIALMEEGAADRLDTLVHSWRELAREERWWLYAKAAAPGQRKGAGWRKALYHALSETPETRIAPPVESQKDSLWEQQAPALPPQDLSKTSLVGPEATKSRRSKRKTAPTSEDGQMRFL